MSAPDTTGGHAGTSDPIEALRMSTSRANAMADAAALRRETGPPEAPTPAVPGDTKDDPFADPVPWDHAAAMPVAHMSAPPKQHNRSAKKITRARLVGCLIDLRARLRHDVFADEPQIRIDSAPWQALSGTTLRRLWADSESVLNFLPAQSVFNELALDEAERHSFDPLTEYLDALQWDGVARIDRMLADYLGADDTALHAEFGACTMIGAVRRAFEPGAKHDTMLVLEGPQGARKSSAVAALCPHARWFTDSLKLDAEQREIIEQSAGKWIVEVAELGGMRKADIDNLKAALSRPSDRARKAYGRDPQERPRRFIFIGTVNPGPTGFLKDGTGNRRFWICPVGNIDPDAIARDRDQLWAEAVARYQLGEANWLSPESAAVAEGVAEDRREDIPWADTLRERLAHVHETTASAALRELGVSPDREDRAAQMAVAEALKEIGFRKGNKQGGRPRAWRRV